MRVAVIGAGQLGQMLGFAARELGIECVFLDPASNPPAAQCGDVISAPFDDLDALRKLAANCDVLTYEFENVPVSALEAIAADIDVFPPPRALKKAQDRLVEKQLFETLGMALPAYHRIDAREHLDQAEQQLGLPMVIKTRRFGYDGKGQCVVRTQEEKDTVWQQLGGQPLIAEAWVDFDYEVSIIGVRGREGEIAIYPMARNTHQDGILRRSMSPIDAPKIETLAKRYATDLLQHLDYVGVVALELFVVGEQLLVNEFAPRVHNSGHWTIEGSVVSQFSNHLLAVTGRALGSTDGRGFAGMINLIGTIPDSVRNLSIGTLHDYGKAPREGRKLGHITVTAASAALRDAHVEIIDKNVT